MSRKTQLPLIHLDQQYWNPGWVETSAEEWRKKIIDLVEQDEWIMDGNYASTFNLRFPKADTIIYLDYSRPVALYRALKRTLKLHGKVRQDMASDCPERFNWEFLQYVWSFHKLHRPKIETALLDLSKDQTLYRIADPREANSLIERIVRFKPERDRQ
ncbi:MAG: hypothetical protein KDD50_09975 [Bdellovibrionales bacterium]|nr:hypothetical protein [Bdellovibrionales bacterium]